MKTRIGSILIMSFYSDGRHRTIKSIFIVANGICFVVKISYQFFSSPIENSRPKFGSNFQPLKISKVPFGNFWFVLRGKFSARSLSGKSRVPLSSWGWRRCTSWAARPCSRRRSRGSSTREAPDRCWPSRRSAQRCGPASGRWTQQTWRPSCRQRPIEDKDQVRSL